TVTLAKLEPGAVEALIDGMEHRSSPLSWIGLHPFHGVGERIPLESTAFGLRARHFIAENRGGVICLNDTQLSGRMPACGPGLARSRRVRSDVVRGLPDAPSAPSARAGGRSAWSGPPLSTGDCGLAC